MRCQYCDEDALIHCFYCGAEVCFACATLVSSDELSEWMCNECAADCDHVDFEE